MPRSLRGRRGRLGEFHGTAMQLRVRTQRCDRHTDIEGARGLTEDIRGIAPTGEEQVLQLHAEQLHVGKRRADGATVRVSVRSVDRQELVDEELQSEDVEIERVPIDRIVETVPPVREEDGVTIIPVLEEVLVVERRILVKEEIHLRRRILKRRHQQMVTLRTEQAAVERIQRAPDLKSGNTQEKDRTMSSETIVAVYTTAMRAQAAVEGLIAAGVPSNAIEQYARNEQPAGIVRPEGGVAAGETVEGETHTHRGFWAWLTGQDDENHEHHALYDRSVQSGGVVVTVITDSADAGQIEDILQRHDPVDLDEHPTESASDEMYGRAPAGAGAGAGMGAVGGAGVGAGMAAGAGTGAYGARSASEQEPLGVGAATEPQDTLAGRTGTGYETAAGDAARGETARDAMARGTTTEPATAGGLPVSTTGLTGRAGTGNTEEVIPLSEESLQVGKREVDRGTTRIRRYVVERPVEEQIRLRDERVSVFRRPATSGAAVAADAFTDREITVTETDEEAVVGKTARVTEEVVVQKGVEERVETVRDTLRHDEVEIEGPAGHTAADPAARRD